MRRVVLYLAAAIMAIAMFLPTAVEVFAANSPVTGITPLGSGLDNETTETVCVNDG